MRKLIFSIALAAFCAVNIIGCKDDDAPEGPSVKIVSNPTYGKILTDKDGKTLYFFSRDSRGVSVCVDGCAAIWPIFYSESISFESADLSATDFTTITRADNSKQTVYKGYPLYYHSLDAKAGDTMGEKFNNIWYVAKPDYSVMYAKAQLIGHDGKSYKADYTEGVEETFYITDTRGRTLYRFKNDKNNTNNFTANPNNNAAIWPVFPSALSTLIVPSILSRTDFSEATVNGAKQLTYKGWPLYYFGGTATVAGDVNRGENRGISFPMPTVWSVANISTTVAPN